VPAKNPVIAVVVPKYVAATVKRLAALRGVSKSSVVRDFLIETHPVLERIANLLDLAARSDRGALAEWAGTLMQAQQEVEGDALQAMARFDSAIQALQQQLPLKKPGRPMAGERIARHRAGSRRRTRTPGQ